MKTNQKLVPFRRQQKSRLIELPREILCDEIIMKRLPVESVFLIRRVCKTLLNIVDSNSQLYHQIIPSFLKLPAMSQLIPQKGNHVIFHLVFEYAYNPGHKRRPFFRGGLESIDYDDSQCKLTVLGSSFCFPQNFDQVHCVFRHLFCCTQADDDKEAFLINPFRRQVLKLPPTDLPWDFYGMGFDDKTKTYKIVRVKTVLSEEAQVLALDGGSWKEMKPIKFPSFLRNTVVSSWTAVSAYGGMHWLFSEIDNGQKLPAPLVQLLSFDFKTEMFKRTALPLEIHEPSNCRLVTLRESIAIVKAKAEPPLIMIWVMKNWVWSSRPTQCAYPPKQKVWEMAYFFNNNKVNIEFGPISQDLKKKFNKKMAESYLSLDKLLICNEWEHGIFFSSEDKDTDILLFLDVDNLSMRIVTCPSNNKGRFFSVKGSCLISTEDVETNSDHSRKRSRAVYGKVRSSVKTRKIKTSTDAGASINEDVRPKRSTKPPSYLQDFVRK